MTRALVTKGNGNKGRPNNSNLQQSSRKFRKLFYLSGKSNHRAYNVKPIKCSKLACTSLLTIRKVATPSL